MHGGKGLKFKYSSILILIYLSQAASAQPRGKLWENAHMDVTPIY